MPETELGGGLISESSLLLKTLMEGDCLASGSNLLHSSELSGKKLDLYLSVLASICPITG